jgi:hypothetical protein
MDKEYNPFQPIIDNVSNRPYNTTNKFILSDLLHGGIDKEFIQGITNHEIYKPNN